MKTLEDKLDKLIVDVQSSDKEGIPLKLFIAKKILEANDIVSKYFLDFRKKHKKKKNKDKNIIVEEKIIIKDKDPKEKIIIEDKKPKDKKKEKNGRKEKKERVVEEVSNLSLGRLSSLLKEVDDFNLENNN